MRPIFIRAGIFYRCLAHDRGYEKCGQKAARVTTIDGQLVAILSQLDIPDGFRERVEDAVRNRVENEASLQRMAEVQAIVERIDFSWEQGFPEKRRQLNQTECASSG
jgi:hypothetical protein